MRHLLLPPLGLLAACAPRAELVSPAAARPEHGPVRVHVTVDFAPLLRPPLTGTVELGAQACTVVDATRALAPVEQDVLCCSPEDVWSIAGVGPDPEHDRYWYWTLGGGAGRSLPVQHVLADGDQVLWRLSGRQGGARASAASAVRAVSLLPAATEIAIAIGAADRLVALSHLCPMPAGQELPRVLSTSIDSLRWSMGEIDRAVRAASASRESPYQLAEERIRELKPTLVLSQGLCPVCAATPGDVAPALAGPAGRCAELLVLSPRSLADVAEDIRRVGKAMGREHPARVAARLFERRIGRVRTLPGIAPRPRVAVVEWFDPPWISGEWCAEMVAVAGGIPVLASPADPSRRIGFDELAAADPDVVVLAACSMSVARAERELPALRAAPEWARLRAVRAGRVFLMDGEAHFSTPGPRLAEGVELLARILRDPDHTAPERPGSWQRVAPPR